MQLGMFGLGPIGANGVPRPMSAGHQCVVYDRNPSAVSTLAADPAARRSSQQAEGVKTKH